MIRLVVTDLDGTLWGLDMVVPEAHRRAIGALADLGVAVLPATSRRSSVVAEAFSRVDLAPPAVVMDGALGVDLRTGERFHEALFSRSAAIEVLATFQRFGLEPCVYPDDPVFDVVLPEHPSTCPAHAEYLRGVAQVGSLQEAVETVPVFQFAVLGLPLERLEAAAAALNATGAEAVMHREPRFGGWGLIVGPPGVTKWNGVLAYCSLAGIDPAHVLAVGDGDNDVAMLEHAAVAVGVRGGTERSLAAADLLIDPPGLDGWAAIVDIVTQSA